jgi:hypothetical protein
MPKAKKSAAAAASPKPRIGRPPKTTSKIPGLMGAGSSASRTNGSHVTVSASAKKPIGRPLGTKPGGHQLPQGVNALHASIAEYMRTDKHRITIPAAKQILKILVNLP